MEENPNIPKPTEGQSRLLHDKLEKNQSMPGPPEPGSTIPGNNLEINGIIKDIDNVMAECSKMIIGQKQMLELILICILSDGHILLEGVPGIAKTLAAKTVAQTINSDFSRIQFTPDLMPTDIIGTSVFNMKEGEFYFKKGPIFSNIILIDEINRAPAKTQSALFEVMEEHQISFDGDLYEMSSPFLVIATQNPIEQEGTYRLPEAQLDRFLMKINLGYPNKKEEVGILERYKNNIGPADLSEVQKILSPDRIDEMQKTISEVFIKDDIINYIVELVQETREHSKIYLGASPRASLALLKSSKVAAVIGGRDFVIPEDVQYVAPFILNHRVILTPDAEMEGLDSYDVIGEIVKGKEVPR